MLFAVYLREFYFSWFCGFSSHPLLMLPWIQWGLSHEKMFMHYGVIFDCTRCSLCQNISFVALMCTIILCIQQRFREVKVGVSCCGNWCFRTMLRSSVIIKLESLLSRPFYLYWAEYCQIPKCIFTLPWQPQESTTSSGQCWTTFQALSANIQFNFAATLLWQQHFVW